MTRIDHSEGTDNVLLDLGFEDAEELSAKAALALKLSELIDQRSLSQTEAAAITGMTQPKVSQVRRYKLQNISRTADAGTGFAGSARRNRGAACAQYPRARHHCRGLNPMARSPLVEALRADLAALQEAGAIDADHAAGVRRGVVAKCPGRFSYR